MGVPLPKSPALRTALVLAGIFALSMAFRAPFLGRPLGAYYETTTSTVLTTQRIWHEGRIIADRFLPVMSYPLRTDKNINNWASVKLKNISSQNYGKNSDKNFIVQYIDDNASVKMMLEN